mgnify:FL=1
MKTLKVFMLVAVLLCCPFFLDAQELQEYEPVKALYLDGGKFYIYNDPEPLTEYEVLDFFGRDIYNETYVGAKKQMKIGKPLIITGSVVAGIGIVAALLGAAYESEGLYGSGLIATCVGMSALSVGTPLYCVGRARLNWMVDDYNSRLSRGELNVSLGPQRHGVGLSINF